MEKIKVGSIVENIQTGAIYVIIEDKAPIEPITQLRITNFLVNQDKYKILIEK